MKSNNYLIGLSIQFFVLGFGSGVTADQWLARRERMSFNILIALLLRQLVVLWQPNKQMESTAPSVLIESRPLGFAGRLFQIGGCANKALHLSFSVRQKRSTPWRPMVFEANR